LTSLQSGSSCKKGLSIVLETSAATRRGHRH